MARYLELSQTVTVPIQFPIQVTVPIQVKPGMKYYFQRQNHITVFRLQLQTRKVGWERTLELTFCKRIGTKTSIKRYGEWVPTKLTKPSTMPAELLGDNGRLWKILTSKLAEVSNIPHIVTNPLQQMRAKCAGIYVNLDHLPLCLTGSTFGLISRHYGRSFVYSRRRRLQQMGGAA